MATATMNYSEDQMSHGLPSISGAAGDQSEAGGHYEGDTDVQSTTMTIQTGASSGYRTNHLSLSRLSRHSVKIKASSSFPNLLSLYHTPIREESNLGQEVRKEKKVKKREKRKAPRKRPDYDENHEKRNRQEHRNIRVEVVAREQLEKFDNYVRSMKDKVDKQREERKKYNENLQDRLKDQEESEKKSLRLHRGPKHVYVHDRSYLKTLPVSNYCKATRLADDLQRKGVLRTRADVEKYWSGLGHTQRKSVDIFAADSMTSVNYPNQWMGVRKPKITIDDDDDSETQTDAASSRHPAQHQTLQLPPLKNHKKKTKKNKA